MTAAAVKPLKIVSIAYCWNNLLLLEHFFLKKEPIKTKIIQKNHKRFNRLTAALPSVCAARRTCMPADTLCVRMCVYACT